MNKIILIGLLMVSVFIKCSQHPVIEHANRQVKDESDFQLSLLDTIAKEAGVGLTSLLVVSCALSTPLVMLPFGTLSAGISAGLCIPFSIPFCVIGGYYSKKAIKSACMLNNRPAIASVYQEL